MNKCYTRRKTIISGVSLLKEEIPLEIEQRILVINDVVISGPGVLHHINQLSKICLIQLLLFVYTTFLCTYIYTGKYRLFQKYCQIWIKNTYYMVLEMVYC